MRIVKASVGWLCFLCILAAIFFTGYWAYGIISPFFNGAKLYRLPPPDPKEMAELLGKSGIGRSNLNSMLKDYASREVEPAEVITGWEALAVRLDEWFAISKSSKRNNVAAAAILNEETKVVAAYPKGMIGWVTGSNYPLSEMEDDPNTGRYPYWRSVFARRADVYADDVGDVYMTRILSPDGRTIALLVTVSRDRLVPYIVPATMPFIAPKAAGNLAILTFIAYLLLLPAWVAMDAAWRGMRPFAWGVLVLLTNLIGLGAYMIARLPAPSRCPNCGERVLGKYVRCPACGVSLQLTCAVCRTPMRPGWQYCPICSGVPRPSASPAAEAPAIRQARLEVCVADADSGAPIPNARVSISGLVNMEGLTGRGGAFQAIRLAAGAYKVTVSRYGYDSAEAELEIGEEACESVQLRLRALPGRIVGRVVDRSRKPIGGARVFLDSDRLDRSAQTGPDGGFVLADVIPGPYNVRVEAEGFAPASKVADIGPGHQASLDFILEPTA